jgi:hypothetical protein
VVDLDAAFVEQFLDIALRQAVAQVPAHRHHDHLGRESEAGERLHVRLANCVRWPDVRLRAR